MTDHFPVGADSPNAEFSWRSAPGAGIPVGPWIVVLVVLLAAAAYVGTLAYQFVWDDVLLLNNPRFQRLQNLSPLLREDFTALTAGEFHGRYYRPVLALSLTLDAALWGLNPGPFHLVNLLLHVAATFLVVRLVVALGGGGCPAILTGLLFAIHPVHVEAVTFVSARDNLWLTISAVGCLLAHRRAQEAGRRRIPWTLAALACQSFALLAKEVALVLPALLVASDGLRPLHLTERPGESPWRRALVRSLPYWGVGVTYAAFRFPAFVQLAGDRLHAAGLWDRLPGALETLERYVWLSLFPTHMQPIYDLERPMSVLALRPMLGLLAGVVLVALLVVWRRRAPLAAFGVAWFLVTVMPVVDLVPFSFRPMGLADRYLYLPSVGLCLVLALGLSRPLECSARARRFIGRIAGWIPLALLLIFYPFFLLRYAPAWQDNLTLYALMERVAPPLPRPLIQPRALVHGRQ